MLPFQGSSEAFLCSVGQASPWWHWPLMDLGGLHACHKHIQRNWQSCSWLHTSCSAPVHVLFMNLCSFMSSSSLPCMMISSVILMTPSQQSRIWSSPGRYPVHMWVWMEDVQSKIVLCVCWRLSEEMIHSWELCNSKIKIYLLWWIL